jgi:steroid delta-isomerase-like uncharacterized protein
MKPLPPGANERTIRRYFGELFNQGRLELVPELLAEDYVNHSPGWPGLPAGREGVAEVVRVMRAAFPDLHYEIEDLVVGEAAVAARTLVSGTHRGEFFGLAPTGRAFRISQITVEHLRDGRIVAHHRVTDELSLLRQIGALA